MRHQTCGQGDSPLLASPALSDDMVPTDDEKKGLYVRPVKPAKTRAHTRRRLLHAFMQLRDQAKACKPQLVVFLPGLDGHVADPGMKGRGGLKSSDYRWMVRHLKRVVAELGHHRLVVNLEGGYATEGGAAGPLAWTIHEVVSERGEREKEKRGGGRGRGKRRKGVDQLQPGALCGCYVLGGGALIDRSRGGRPRTMRQTCSPSDVG